ncbi:predicted protein [Nematostella vectensis]|uniref:Fungal lipase-type domain-containing protein n=1 Tax=Nematostella vectensis TaxID=45351 RepID=A7RJ46_NEMVE|nr:predicted protein [Nematostella vectensis]|eukprot:XP_001640576.1 predicted protein [Nematostella vectensis]
MPLELSALRDWSERLRYLFMLHVSCYKQIYTTCMTVFLELSKTSPTMCSRMKKRVMLTRPNIWGCRKEKENFVIKTSMLMIIGIAYFAIIILASNARVTCGADCQLGPTTKLSHSYHTKRPNKLGYPICGKTWGSLELRITDWAFLADLAYKIGGNKTQFLHRVDEYFKERGKRWEIITMTTKKPTFYHIREVERKVNIVGIRGTADSRDWFENAKIWNEIATFQVTSVFLPIQHLPLDFIAFFIARASFLDYTLHHASYNYYFKVIEQYVQDISANTTEEVYLVGHSLGGGVAKLVGCRNQVQAISLSSPGEIYNHGKFGYSLDDIQEYTTSVIAQHDLVTWIDKPGGLVQYVKCDDSSFLNCHSIRKTYCELKKKCDSVTAIDCP